MCAQCVAHTQQCKQKMCLLGFKFDQACWKKRHMARLQMCISKFDWVSLKNASELVGLVELIDGTIYGPHTEGGIEMNIDHTPLNNDTPFKGECPASNNDPVRPFELLSLQCQSLKTVSFLSGYVRDGISLRQ